MASLGKIIRDDRHPAWLVDAIIMSAVVYSPAPATELEVMKEVYGLDTSKYEFFPEEEMKVAGLEQCQQPLLVVRSRSVKDGPPHIVVACRGTCSMSDAIADLNFLHRSMSLGQGAAHAGFLDRAKSIPLDYFRRLLIRGEKLVLTGHSLGGAVASLLALRLLEATGRWCHQQLQCYTFGCPFFADSKLAKHINTQYKQHFVHIVSRNDLVPKVMPLAYTIYIMWAGLQAGPLQDLVHISRVTMLMVQFAAKLKAFRRHTRLPMMAMSTQILTYCPALLRALLHRAFVLALSHHSGYGYTFAGHMVLLDPETSKLEHSDNEAWNLGKHLNFHFGTVSLDALKEHSLVSYIEHVFTVQSQAQSCAGTQVAVGSSLTADLITSRLDVCKATLRTKWLGKRTGMAKESKGMAKESKGMAKESKGMAKETKHVTMLQAIGRTTKSIGSNHKNPKKGARALRTKVACLIFARRMQEAAPNYVNRKRNGKLPRFFLDNVGRIARLGSTFDRFLMLSSTLLALLQVRKLLLPV